MAAADDRRAERIRLEAEYDDLVRRREELLARMRREGMFTPPEVFNQIEQLNNLINQLVQRILVVNPFFNRHWTRGRKSLTRRQNKSKKTKRSSRSSRSRRSRK